MMTTAELLEMYKEEKTAAIGDENERTGLEDFPSFKEWKKEYLADREELLTGFSTTVTMEEAVDLTDEELDNGSDTEDLNLTLTEDDDMTDTNTTETVDNTEVTATEPTTEAAPATTEETAPKAPAKRTTKKKAAKKAAKKATGSKVAAKGTKGPSKADAARKIFAKMYPQVQAGKKARKDVIEQFQTVAGLSKAGAATYYQNFKKAAS